MRGKEDREPWPAYRERASISVACVIDLDNGLPVFYTAADKGEYGIEGLVKALEAAPLVVSYNGESYDNVVLEAMLKRRLKLHHHIDIYARIKEALAGEQWGRGSWTLDRVAKDVLGFGKTNVAGAMAPSLWAGHAYGELFTYSFRDTWLTWGLWRWVNDNGYVLDPLGGRLEVTW